MAQVNMAQVERIAEVLKNMPESDPPAGGGMNFYSFLDKKGKEIVASDMYPSLNHPQAVNFFFFNCLQQFGFWYGDDQGYVEPLYGIIDGKRAKGSDLLWKVCKKTLDRDDDYNKSAHCYGVQTGICRNSFDPENLAKIGPCGLTEIFSDDNGPIPFPDFEERFKMTRAYGRWFAENYMGLNPSLTPSEIIRRANKGGANSLGSFLAMMNYVPGYNKDALQKRQLLLAMALNNRPERFLEVNDPKNWAPIVDYHLMRINLRLGTVVLDPFAELHLLEKRKWVSAEMEQDVRLKVRDATKKLIELSGKSMPFVDEKLWMARRYCPEMEKPDCPNCLFYAVCEKKIDLFQPVFRTTAY